MSSGRPQITERAGSARSFRPSLAARAVFVLACGVALVIPIARSDAQTIDGLEGKIADARDEAEALNDQIESDVVALAEARNDAERAAGEESELSKVLAEGQERSAALARKLEDAQAELAATQERLERAQAVLAQRLVEIYKSSGMNGVDVLLDSEGFEDLATRAELLGRIQDADRALAERVRELKADVQDQVERVGRAKERSDELNAEVEAARDEIAAARAAAEARAAQLQDARAAQAASVERAPGPDERLDESGREARASARRRGRRGGRKLEQLRRLGHPRGDRHVRVRRQLPGAEPQLRSRRRLSDPSLDLGGSTAARGSRTRRLRPSSTASRR